VVPDRLPGIPDRPVLNYVEQVNRLNLSVGQGPWTGLVQVDEVLLAANRYKLDGAIHEERQLLSPDIAWPLHFGTWYLNPEKVSLRWKKGDLSVKVGDFYAAFGNGLALNVNRDVDIDIDTSLQGVHVLYRGAVWDIEGLFGQANRQQVSQDNPNLGLYGDLRHTVAGVRLVRYGLGPATVGLHGVLYDFVDQTGWKAGFTNLSTAPDVVVGGATLDMTGVGGIDWNLEGDLFTFPTAVAWGGADPHPGYALYGSAVWYAGRTTWQLEGKRYEDAQRVNSPVTAELYQFAVGPTLEYERAITEDSGAAVNSNDIYGGRLRVDWAAVPGQTVPYASLAVFRDLDTGGLHFNTVPETIVHPMLGTEMHGDAVDLVLNGGFRMDLRDGTPLSGGDRQLHGDADVKVPLAGPVHLDVALSGEWFQWGNNPIQQSDYAEMESSVGLLVGPKVAVTWFTDYSDNPLVNTEGNLAPDWYGALEVQYKPLPALTLKAFGGAYKSGIRCSGGQCRVLPGFEGVRASATGTF